MEKIVIAIDTMGTDNGSAYFVQGPPDKIAAVRSGMRALESI